MEDGKAQNIRRLLGLIKILIVDDESYSRKVIRTLLLAIGVEKIIEARDGASGLDAIVTNSPDLVLLDWQMPGMDGAEFLRKVRSPATFSHPAVPIVMLTGHGEKSRVLYAANLGVHDFLLKPVSRTALLTRIVDVLTKPRPMIQSGSYYGPAPRKQSMYKPDLEHGIGRHRFETSNDLADGAPRVVILSS